MGLLDGTRSGDGLLLLSNEREIDRDDLWAIRFLAALFIVPAVATNPAEYTGPDGPLVLVGLFVIVAPLYWVALRLTSDAADSPTTTEVAETAP